ncbi:MATE family efflux transporter [Marinomonas algicola]|uniref:MATE family efflux transporter n=1 Tax=Marinomonas algicola TaxID=2773454 RepID=UPI00174C404B|nr:MATE family efflux transporter [Marinomonas algicola]
MPKQATFTQGSTLKHVVVMSATGALGLMCMFLVDLVDMWFLSMLGKQEAVAAVGFASTILFFTISISIAVAIAATALISRAVGAGDMALAKRRSVNSLVYGVVFSSFLVWLIYPNIPHILLYIGASSRTLDLSIEYLQVLIWGMPAVMVAMIGSGIMRAIGDAKRAMYATFLGGLVNAVLDPILIFGFGLEVQGAAIASLIARFSMVGITYYCVIHLHKMLAQFDLLDFYKDVRVISLIAIPAMLTNLSSPLANLIVMEHSAAFGDDVVAGIAIIGRIIPVVFGGLFALSGAVGPILGQNFGAKSFERMKSTLTSAVIYSFCYCLVMCLLLFVSQDWLIETFNAKAATAELIRFFASFISFSFFFQSLLFIALATFNNLGRPYVGTALNFARATLGTWPLIIIFSWGIGAEGILFGQAVGSIIFGCIGFYMARKYVAELEHKDAELLRIDPSINYDELAS